MLVDDPAWEEIRRLYIESDLTVLELSDRFDLSRSAIFARRRAEQWPSRVGRRRRAGTNTCEKLEVITPRARTCRGETRHRGLIRRLYSTLDLKLQHMEKRMRDGEILPATDEEREARTLNTLLRSLEKALQIDPTPETSRAGGTSSGGASADLERRRHEIAARLERLSTGGEAQGASC